MVQAARQYDALYDPLFTVSAPSDHYHAQAQAGGVQLERAPVFANFMSNLPHYPASTLRFKATDRVPEWVSRDYAPPIPDARDAALRSSTRAVGGAERCKFAQRPFLASHAPVVLVKAPKAPDGQVLDTSGDAIAVHDEAFEPGARDVSVQSDFRESEAQTDPYSPDAVVAQQFPERQHILMRRHHCHAPELLTLRDMMFSINAIAPTAADVERVNKLRAKRAFEATLPPLADVARLPQRLKMMEAWEAREWQEREAELEASQSQRLDMLRDAILAREAEIEASHSERVNATVKWLMAAKQDTFARVQKRRVAALRRFAEARRYAEHNRWQVAQQTSIIDIFDDDGSHVYAPLQRNGRVQDAHAHVQGRLPDHFVPSGLDGVDAVQEMLHRHLRVKALRALPDLNSTSSRSQRHGGDLRAHVERTAASLQSARERGIAVGASHGGLGFSDAWPHPVAGVSQKRGARTQKVAFRNAARPTTPVLAAPSDDGRKHAAAVLLQRLLRGRAMQVYMLASAKHNRHLITDLMPPATRQASTTRAAGICSDEAVQAPASSAPAVTPLPGSHVGLSALDGAQEVSATAPSARSSAAAAAVNAQDTQQLIKLQAEVPKMFHCRGDCGARAQEAEAHPGTVVPSLASDAPHVPHVMVGSTHGSDEQNVLVVDSPSAAIQERISSTMEEVA